MSLLPTPAQPAGAAVGSPTGADYWMVAEDGGIFNFGDACFYGSLGGTKLNQQARRHRDGLGSSPVAVIS